MAIVQKNNDLPRRGRVPRVDFGEKELGLNRRILVHKLLCCLQSFAFNNDHRTSTILKRPAQNECSQCLEPFHVCNMLRSPLLTNGFSFEPSRSGSVYDDEILA